MVNKAYLWISNWSHYKIVIVLLAYPSYEITQDRDFRFYRLENCVAIFEEFVYFTLTHFRKRACLALQLIKILISRYAKYHH